MAELEVDDITLSWDYRIVCEDIAFSLDHGEVVCLVGRSGSGKTTIFDAIAGLTKPDSGRILLNGEDVTGRPGHISYMLQKDLLLAQHSILDNVSMPLRIKGESKKAARTRAKELLARFGLDGTGDLYPSQLSGGMRQRAALLRTYLMQNDVILLDEPFSALDALTRKDMQAWFLQMMASLGLSAVLVTHDVDEAISLADRILVLGSPDGSPPSTLVAQIEVPASRESREDFALAPEALEIKRQILSYLE